MLIMTRLYSQDMRHGDKEGCDGILLQTFVIHSGHRPGLLGLLTVPGVDLSLLLKIEKNKERRTHFRLRLCDSKCEAFIMVLRILWILEDFFKTA